MCRSLVASRSNGSFGHHGTRVTALASRTPAPGKPDRRLVHDAPRQRAARGPACILVVDDNPQTLGYVRDALAQTHYAPVLTGDPRELMGRLPELAIDYERHRVTVTGCLVSLTATEYELTTRRSSAPAGMEREHASTKMAIRETMSQCPGSYGWRFHRRHSPGCLQGLSHFGHDCVVRGGLPCPPLEEFPAGR